jgi:hypothetical protein
MLFLLQLLQILAYFRPSDLNDLPILNRSGNVNLLIILPSNPIFYKFPQNPSQRLSTPRLRNHALPLDDPSQTSDRTNLFANNGVYSREELLRWGCGEALVGGSGGNDECEGEVAFHSIGDADYAGFGDGFVGCYSLFDSAWAGVSIEE